MTYIINNIISQKNGVFEQKSTPLPASLRHQTITSDQSQDGDRSTTEQML